MKILDLYFQTESRAAFFLDLLELGLVEIGASLFATPVHGVSIDYVGRMVKTPATIDASSFPPVVTAEPEYYPGERANVRLTGDKADELGALLAAAEFKHGTALMNPPSEPKRVWA